MAGRFLFQKLSSRIASTSRSLSLSVGAHAAASDIAAPVCRRVSEGGSGTLSSFLHGSAAHSSMPIPSNCVIHRRCAARYFNTLPWTSSAANFNTNGMASAVAHRAKPAFVDSAGVKPTFSSNLPTKDTVTWEAKRAAWEAEMKSKRSALEYRSASEAEVEAEKKAIIDDFKAWKTKLDKDVADFSSYVTRLVLVWTLVGIGFIVESSRRSYVQGKNSEIAANDNAVVRGPSAS